MDPRDLDTLDRHLPRGKALATSVSALGSELYPDMSKDTRERLVREGIEHLVNDRHVPVVTLPQSPGVFVATTPEELDEAFWIRGKAKAELRRCRSLRLCREELAWSPTLFSREVA